VLDPQVLDMHEPPDSFRRDGLGYVYEPPGAPFRLRIDFIDHGKGELSGEVVGESTSPGVPPHLFRTRLNLLVAARLKDINSQLLAAIPSERGWDRQVRSFAEAVITAEREGEPFVLVGRRPARLRPADRVERLVVEGKPTLLYGPGGAGKGYLAAGLGVAVSAGVSFAGLRAQPGEVLYLDWEDDEDELDERVKEVSRGFGVEAPDIHYRAMREPLHHAVNRIARYVTEYDIKLIIVDSFELAAGGAGDRGTYEEAAKRIFLALRQIGPCSALLIDHVSEAARQNKQDVNKAYGAIFKANWCRRAFEVKVDQSPAEKTNHVGLYLFKTNRGEMFGPLGFAIDFGMPGAVSFRREDIRDNPELGLALPAQDRLSQVLRAGPLTAKQAAEESGVASDTCRVVLNRYKGKRFTKLDDDRWALLVTEPPRPMFREGVSNDLDLPF
jgi:hypothetical protein